MRPFNLSVNHSEGAFGFVPLSLKQVLLSRGCGVRVTRTLRLQDELGGAVWVQQSPEGPR